MPALLAAFGAYDDLWLPFVDANFDMVAIGAAQNSVVQNEGGVCR